MAYQRNSAVTALVGMYPPEDKKLDIYEHQSVIAHIVSRIFTTQRWVAVVAAGNIIKNLYLKS